ncbi:MAG: alcohol dehydrogenase catalytic domain-containing protein [Myxococcota bacterium]
MRAMVLSRLAPLADEPEPLALRDLPVPVPGADELLVEVAACGVCHTELDEIEGRTPPPRLPVVLGHQIVGRVRAVGSDALAARVGERVGVGWIHRSDGSARENLSPAFRATGRDVDGGYAEYAIAAADYAFPVPDAFDDAEAAPLLCAGAIGHRALRLAQIEDGQVLGLMGFGGSAHLVLQLARHRFPNARIFAFARDPEVRAFALREGADWAGATRDAPPAPLDAAIDTTPAWEPVVASLAALAPGGRLVVNAIRKEERDKRALLDLSYHEHLWMEREIKSVANITGSDVREFLAEAAEIPIRPRVETYPLEDANRALRELAAGRVRGAKVLRIGGASGR